MGRMNKEKNTLKVTYITFLILLLLVISLFVSCDEKSLAPENDVCSYITFKGENSRALVKYDLVKYKDIYWFYKAAKVNGGGETGAKTEWTPINISENAISTGLGSSKLGPFSVGEWKFEIKAYKTAMSTTEKPTDESTEYASYTFSETTTAEDGTATTLEKTIYFTLSDPVYQTGNDGITATLTKSYETVFVNVKSSAESGTLIFDSLSFESSTGIELVKVSLVSTEGSATTYSYSSVTETGELSLTVTGTEGTNPTAYTCTLSFKSGTGTVEKDGEYGVALPDGTYKCTIEGYETSSTGDSAAPSFTSTLNFAVEGGATTIVSGKVTKSQ